MVEEEYGVDRTIDNIFWEDVIANEMKSAKVVFKILDYGEKVPSGYQYIKCQIIFDIKM